MNRIQVEQPATARWPEKEEEEEATDHGEPEAQKAGQQTAAPEHRFFCWEENGVKVALLKRNI